MDEAFVNALADLDLTLDEALPRIEADVKQREREYEELVRIDRLKGAARAAAIRELGRAVRESTREIRALRKVQSKAVRGLIRDGYSLERIAAESGLTLEAIRDLVPRRWRWFRHLTPTTKGRP